MQIYQVGGAVRDEALGLPIKERDWVVVGGTPDALTSQGYKPVGRDFPVFLHPKTHEEYALARTERKAGTGHTGFICHFEPSTTLEEDLMRRDLTINAMAKSSDGKVFDPYGGMRDLNARVLRHVSPAFVEDPLRVLRVARFAATLEPFHFTLAPETLHLMQNMVAKGELATLTPERVWKELMKAMLAPSPHMFFEVLEVCDALPVLFPEIQDWTPVLQDLKAYVQANSNVHAPSEPTVAECRWACSVSSLPNSVLRQLHSRLRVPAGVASLAQALSEARRVSHTVDGILTWLNEADPRRAPDRFKAVCNILPVLGHGDLANLLRVIGEQYVQTITLTKEEQAWPSTQIQATLLQRKRDLITRCLDKT